MTVLALTTVNRVFGRGAAECRALCDVTLDVARGERVAVTGPSGSGKSTLLHLAAGLDAPTSGTVRLLDADLSAGSEADRAICRRANVGYVFQAFNLLGALTLAENIELSLVVNGWSADRRRQRVQQLLEMTGLADKAANLPAELSGGEQQRGAVLRAVAHEPALLLMDEPTSNVDSASARVLLQFLMDLSANQQTTILLATHDPEVIEWFDRRVRLHDGRVVSDGKE